MLKRNVPLAAAVTAITVMLVAASAHAFVTTHVNDLTFSKAVGLPGVTLPAGTYRFEIINSGSGLDVVRVSDKYGSRVYLARHTIRVARPNDLRHNQLITFGEAPAGTPPPIRVWFPIGASDGRQFVY